MQHTVLDQAQVAVDWEKRGFCCSLWLDPPGQIWENYVHDTDELLMVLSGEVEVEMEGQCLRPEPGVEVLIPAGTPHTVRNVGAGSSEWLYGYRRD